VFGLPKDTGHFIGEPAAAGRENADPSLFKEVLATKKREMPAQPPHGTPHVVDREMQRQRLMLPAPQ